MTKRRPTTHGAQRKGVHRRKSSAASSATWPGGFFASWKGRLSLLDRHRSILAISLAIAAAEHGRRVYYGTLADLIGSLEEAKAAGRLTHRLKTLTYPALLVVDEIGYLPISPTGAMLFFQLMTRRYEHGSTVLTSNKSFEEWGDIFGDEVMAAALIDRLVHHCHIVNIRGNSFRMRQHRELWQSLQPDQDEAAPAPKRPRQRREVQTTA